MELAHTEPTITAWVDQPPKDQETLQPSALVGLLTVLIEPSASRSVKESSALILRNRTKSKPSCLNVIPAKKTEHKVRGFLKKAILKNSKDYLEESQASQDTPAIQI